MITHIHVPRHRLLTTKHAAHLLSIDESTIHKWSQSGVIKRYETMIPGEFRYAETELKSLIDGTSQSKLATANR